MRRTLPQPSEISNYDRGIPTHGNTYLYIRIVSLLRLMNLDPIPIARLIRPMLVTRTQNLNIQDYKYKCKVGQIIIY